MANDAPENKGIKINESFNQAVEVKKSFNPAVPLKQTISQAQATDANTAAGNTTPAANTSSGNE